MLKKNSSIIITLISFICFYLAIIFDLEYLNIAFIPIFIYIQKQNSKKNYDSKIVEKFRKNSILIAIIFLIIFFTLRLVLNVDRIYYSIFSSLVLSISIFRGSIK